MNGIDKESEVISRTFFHFSIVLNKFILFFLTELMSGAPVIL